MIAAPEDIQKRDMLFISHATPEDNEFARLLALQLAKEGFAIWCDLTKLLGGEPFWKEIETAIRTRSRKFLFVLSKSSNGKDGTLAELSVASSVRKQLQDDRFIIPLRIDDLPFSDINISLHQLNAIDFSKGWMTGFRKLIERLKDDGVETDKRFGSEAVAVWWREHFGENEGVSETTDYYCSNRLAIRSLPDEVTVLRLERELPEDFDLSTAPFAIRPALRCARFHRHRDRSQRAVPGHRLVRHSRCRRQRHHPRRAALPRRLRQRTGHRRAQRPQGPLH